MKFYPMCGLLVVLLSACSPDQSEDQDETATQSAAEQTSEVATAEATAPAQAPTRADDVRCVALLNARWPHVCKFVWWRYCYGQATAAPREDLPHC